MESEHPYDTLVAGISNKLMAHSEKLNSSDISDQEMIDLMSMIELSGIHSVASFAMMKTQDKDKAIRWITEYLEAKNISKQNHDFLKSMGKSIEEIWHDQTKNFKDQ